jgi:ABC-type sulfate/molybdate transport systems ATPase subunit
MKQLIFEFDHEISWSIQLKAKGRFDFKKNQNTLAIFGESGCGKTTLIRLLLGLEKAPSGRVSFGEKIWQNENQFMPLHQRRIGFVPQKECLFQFLNVFDNIAYSIRKLSSQEKQFRVLELLKILKIENLRDRKISEISGGQKQRVSLARALANRPQLLLLDEAFTNLDLESRQAFLPELSLWLEKMDIASLMISHDERDALLFSSHIFKFKDHSLQIS